MSLRSLFFSLAVLAALLGAILFFLSFSGDELSRLKARIAEGTELANRYRHAELADYLSTDLRERLRGRGIPLPVMLKQLAEGDRAAQAQYEFVRVGEFSADAGEAVAEFKRITPSGRAEGFELFFILEDGTWRAHDRHAEERLQPRRLPFLP
ncbi:MAG: hypothetical protein AAGK14_01240 [Verrucomicrobiota bacterium]